MKRLGARLIGIPIFETMYRSATAVFVLLFIGAAPMWAQSWIPLKPSVAQPEWEQLLWAQPWSAVDAASVVQVQQTYEQFQKKNPDAATTYADRYLRAWVGTIGCGPRWQNPRAT